MIRSIMITIFFTCVYAAAYTQVNYVKNPSFEEFSLCPTDADQITYAKNWSNAIDTVFHSSSNWQSEYYNSCAIGNNKVQIPNNIGFYQNARTGNAIVGASFYFDKSPPSSVYPDYREYIQGRFFATLQIGKIYCVKFYVNLMESSGYSHNKIGAYLDNGDINKLSIPKATEITTITPQIFTNTKINDTLNWIKIEGSFSATGNENYITIGNFFKNADVDTEPFWGSQYSYYLIDDVSVIAIDLSADAGKDTWVEVGKKVQIGRVGDTTAQGLDCKWYKKGVLIDSGAIINVNANSSINAIDTYIVVQNICGVIKRDTVNVKTTGLGISEMNFENAFSIFPNPSNGNFSITCFAIPKASITAKVYDLLGRVVHQEPLHFRNKEATLNLNIPSSSYILELKDEAGNVQRERIVVQ